MKKSLFIIDSFNINNLLPLFLNTRQNTKKITKKLRYSSSQQDIHTFFISLKIEFIINNY